MASLQKQVEDRQLPDGRVRRQRRDGVRRRLRNGDDLCVGELCQRSR